MTQEKNSKAICNVPAHKLSFKPLSKEEMQKELNDRMDNINTEFRKGFEFIQSHPKSVTVFGSARFPEDHHDYKKARSVAGRISKELGYAIITGGGPGIMEAANRGAFENDGISLGLTIELPSEQRVNPYITDHIGFHYFFSRKVALSFSAEAYIYFPGGFGTLDELFEILTLIQTGKIDGAPPVILVGKDYWEPLDSYMKDMLLEKHEAIDECDLNLYTITDDEDEILEIVKNAPVRY
ncbi:TIGR00730 family Rossman fold protein [Candidatus Wolfebacteria bacterium]|nr:MAG: TIGR00730 family Rossman fold protein [Candidatus Wolfebacteria bacterium]